VLLDKLRTAVFTIDALHQLTEANMPPILAAAFAH
jgi:hypothetical protein